MLNIDQHSLSIWVVSLLLLLSFLLLLKTKTWNKKLPPGPPKLPLLGHLLLIGSLPHRSLWKLSRKYGPIMLLKLGSVPTIVISSADAAREVLQVHDLACCSRPRLAASARFSYNFLDIGLSPYSNHWREVRKICVLELFSARRVQSFQLIREEEVALLLNSISQSSSFKIPFDLSENLYTLTANITTRIAFGKSFRGGELDNGNFHQVIRRAIVALGSFSMTDFFPSVGWIIDRLSGVNGRLEKSFAELDAFLQQVVDGRINFSSTSEDEENIVDVLVKMERDRFELGALQLTRDCIKAIIMDIFIAGVNPGAGTIIWAMAELVKNPRLMKKLQDEIRSCIKEDQVKENDLENLPYLKMVVKEVLRLHPPAPLLLPRETMSHFKLNGYDIDPKTHLHVNVWAIGRDPNYWTNPEEFLPERFMASDIDYKGQNFELLAFGAGRRICPGMNMGIVTMELTLANLLLHFNWILPDEMKEVDMEEDPGLTVAKKSPLKLVPISHCNS